MVNHVVGEFGRRPGKHEQIVPISGADFSEGTRTNLFDRNQINDYFCIVLLAPLRCHYLHKPLIKFGKEVRPFSNLEGFLAGESTIRKDKERTEGRRSRCKSEEVTA